ncbi:MAG: hypothetical protein JOZ11_15600, partial [Alphaproteobacteria bacterium]|nr:hypothetical protein [Alphaproteobacteria bacterium]
MHRNRGIRLWRPLVLFIVASVVPGISGHRAFGQSGVPITINSTVPDELNPPFNSGPPASGGAPSATPDQAAAFAWQEFIAVNWPAALASPQHGQPQKRDQPAPESTCHFGDPSADCALLVWETFRGKVEIFPGDGKGPGYNPSTKTFDYDALPAYNYLLPVPACDTKQKDDSTPWVNLDETDQITLDNMYAGVVDPTQQQGNSAPKLIRFLAKANRTEYEYVVGNSDPDPSDFKNHWWVHVPSDVVQATREYLGPPSQGGTRQAPRPGSKTLVSLPNG